MTLVSDIEAPAAESTLRFAEPSFPLVLVVDDHVINRLVVQRQLSLLGYRADAAEHGAAALQAMQMLRYSLLITDCEMPVMNGFDLTRRVRALEAANATPRMPIIAYTASEQTGDQQCCVEVGMDDRLEKPTSLEALRMVMQRWMPDAASPCALNASSMQMSASASADATGDPLPINLDMLRRVTGGDAAASHRALQHFWRVNAVDVAALVQAIDTADMGATVREAHRIKGASRMVGAERFAAVCGDIEIAGRQHDATAFRALKTRFHRELTRLDDYLAAVASA